MSWQDRDYSSDDNPMRGFGRPGGDWQGLRPSFDNPFTWSLSMGRWFGIDVRVHIIFLLYIVISLLKAAWPGEGSVAVNLEIMATAMLILFAVVLLHEFGHCIACRYSGGEADEILMWPLGGLAFTRPLHRWTSHMMTVIGGPLVNVVICIVAGTMLGLLSGVWLGGAIANPLNMVPPEEIARSRVLIALYLVNYLSLILLLFNLLPIFPLDGGRLLQTALWPRFGYVRSMRFAIRTGFIGAICLGVFGAVAERYMLVGIAVFGVLTCWITHRQLAFTEEMIGHENDEFALSHNYGEQEDDDTPARTSREQRQQEKIERQQQEEAEEVDRILKKIGESGMDSLTRRERQLLKRVSERKRQQKESGTGGS